MAETRLSESKARDELKAAEAERALLVQQAMAARQAAEAAKAEEERQRFSAEAERARLAAAAAEDRSRQADAERLRLREDLRQQLNIVLQTRDSARGLIVNHTFVRERARSSRRWRGSSWLIPTSRCRSKATPIALVTKATTKKVRLDFVERTGRIGSRGVQ